MNKKIAMYSPPFPMVKSYVELIDLVCELGVNAVEPFCMFELSEPDIENARELREYADKKGIVFPCLSVYTTITDKDVKTEAERLKKFADVASALGSPYLHHTIVGEVKNPQKVLALKSELMKKGMDFVREIYDYAESIGVKTVYEDQGFIFNGVNNFGEFLAGVNRDVGVVADFGNICQVGERIEDFINAFHDKVVHAHIKDMIVSDAEDCGSPTIDGRFMKSVEIGTGNTDCKGVIDLLESYGYDGYYGIEYTSEDLQVIKQVFNLVDGWLK